MKMVNLKKNKTITLTTKLSDHWPTVTLGGKETMNKPESNEAAGYVAMLECSCGNESVGDMWVEAHVCTSETTIAELMQWKRKHPNGKRLSITQAT